MNATLLVAEQMLLDHLMNNKVTISGEKRLKFALISFAGLMALVAIGFGLYAFYLWLQANYPPVTVMASMAVSTFVISALSLFIVYAILQYKRNRIKRIQNELIDIVEKAFETLEDELSEPVRQNPKISILLSSLMGFLTGDKLL